jgi:YegS/Rv2252/BmrU family lipid kinase
MKVQLIHNPVAGARDVAKDLKQVVSYLQDQGWDVTQRNTLGPGDATTYAREAVQSGSDMVVAVGGDGTLGEVATGLAGSECVLGVLPVGTGNVWAHMLKFPIWSAVHRTALLEAAKILVEGKVHAVDLGRAGERYFMLWIGIGFDAQVAGDVETHRDIRRGIGNLAYLASALAQATVLRGTRTTVVVDDHAMRQRAILVIVANAQLYGPSLRLAPYAQLDDGLLDVYVFKGSSMLDVLRYFALLLIGRHIGHPRIDWYRGRHIEIRASTSLPFHLDGDPAGRTPVTIDVVPKALRVLAPNWASGSLFEGGSGVPEEPTLVERMIEHLRSGREPWIAERDRFWPQR